MSMWEPFTESARKCIVLAQEEAQHLGSDHIGTEHVLLGIISESDNPGAKALNESGVDLKRARDQIATIVPPKERSTRQEMVFTPHAKRLIELAFAEARTLEDNYIGAGHLLLGLLRERGGIAFQALSGMGVKENDLRERVVALIPEEPHPSRRGGGPPARSPSSSMFVTRPPAVMDVLRRADDAAASVGRTEVRGDDVLAGIMRSRQSPARSALIAAGFEIEAKEAPREPSSPRLPYSDEVKRAIGHAFWLEANRLPRDLTCEDLLLGLIQDQAGAASTTLRSHGVNLDALRRALDEDGPG
jgi:ATP-dependent Clp protease ATP-binding subunit ClpA